MAALFLLGNADVQAHPGHPHEKLENPEIVAAARICVDSLITERKIAPDWKDAAEAGVQRIEYEGGVEWRVAFHRPEAENPKRRTLYIFLSEYGECSAANYTGK